MSNVRELGIALGFMLVETDARWMSVSCRADLLHPAVDGEFYHKDFIRHDRIRVSGVFFNVLFNLSKFIEFEQRDPFLLRQQMAEPELT